VDPALKSGIGLLVATRKVNMHCSHESREDTVSLLQRHVDASLQTWIFDIAAVHSGKQAVLTRLSGIVRMAEMETLTAPTVMLAMLSDAITRPASAMKKRTGRMENMMEKKEKRTKGPTRGKRGTRAKNNGGENNSDNSKVHFL